MKNGLDMELLLEDLLENAKVENVYYNECKGSPQTRWEPEEPANIEVAFDMVIENKISVENLEKNPTVRSYAEIYAKKIIDEKLYNEPTPDVEFNEKYDSIEAKLKDNKIVVEVSITVY